MRIYDHSKESLPTGASYPIKRSLLHAAIAEANPTHIPRIDFTRNRTTSGDVLEARFVGEASSSWRSWMRGQVSICVYAVASSDRKAIESGLVANALPMLTVWLANVEQAESVWRGSDHELVFTFRDGRLMHRSA
jgi:hypothetical protein